MYKKPPKQKKPKKLLKFDIELISDTGPKKTTEYFESELKAVIFCREHYIHYIQCTLKNSTTGRVLFKNINQGPRPEINSLNKKNERI